MIARALWLTLALVPVLAACASDARNDSARAWQVAECNRVIDKEDRDRCIRRAEEDHGRRAREAEPRRK